MAEPVLHRGPAVAAGLPVTVTVRYFAAARAAAGLTEEQLTVSGPDVSSPSDVVVPGEITVAAVLAEAADRHGPALAKVLARCSFLLDEVAVHGTGTVIRQGQVLDVLPPFAGG